jgi:hypothetical protein
VDDSEAVNVTFQSAPSYRAFARSVRRNFRHVRPPEQEEFLKLIVATSAERTLTMKMGHILWRAQLGHGWREVQKDVEIEAPYCVNRMKPDPDKVTDGRVNPRRIACLYLATHKESAVLESRPLIGLYASVAQFKIRRNLRLVNCSKREIGNLAFIDKNLSQQDQEKVIWSDMNEAFFAPVSRGDDALDYAPTQIIAETFKLHGFDGIAYKSSYGDDHFNVALFDLQSADLINCELYRVKNICVTMSAQGMQYFVPSPDETPAKPSRKVRASRSKK